ncbi:YraN family protein [Massilibacteroides sp.]|uniref:YraN family protein n=1 Tax=Massilibacteroides sp. TaxID=2034766 RepID=UPI0026356E7D|nr:YraN family protein [Massilibacteroides sp.]MDD4516186.1 YraN family protein [Massilibacteroides sp.]
MAEHNETGKEGEQEASAWLKKNGFSILQTNWRWHHYELDIIAMQENELVVVEVKTRSANYLLPPEKAVTKAKIKRIVSATDAYIRFHNLDVDVRFDVIIVIKGKNGHQIDHIEDAFYAPINR